MTLAKLFAALMTIGIALLGAWVTVGVARQVAAERLQRRRLTRVTRT